MSYNLMEFGGQSTVILRAITDFTVNDFEYKKDDVVFLLKDVTLDFSYHEKSSDVKLGKQNQLFYDERHINTITIGETSLTSNYLQLFCSKIAENYTRTHVEDVFVTDGEMFLTNKITNNVIYILEHGSYIVTINSDYNSISLDAADLLDDGEYTILYQEEMLKPSYDINNSSSIPYLSMEIIGQGNLDKEDSKIYFFIPKVSLLNRPDFSLTRRVTTQNLTFKVIQDIIKVSI